MDQSQIRTLKTLNLKSRPLTNRALAWSCDGELAVATDEIIYIFLPEYPRASKDGEPAAAAAERADAPQHQFSIALQAAGNFRPDAPLNNRLCSLQGIRLPPSEEADRELSVSHIPGREVTGSGASVNQVVRVEWSPNGLGSNLRPVLTALMTSGHMFTIGEEVDAGAAAGSGRGSRNTKLFKILWGLGAELPLPAEDQEGSYRTMDERITSFSWAKEISQGRALLAYATDEDDVVIMSVQRTNSGERSSSSSGTQPVWQIREEARFDSRGPHQPVDLMDSDYVPHGTAFSLNWSPWIEEGDSQVSTLSYISHNYVGFRRVAVNRSWAPGTNPEVKVEESDSASLCVFLSTDAFVEWESKLSKPACEATPNSRMWHDIPPIVRIKPHIWSGASLPHQARTLNIDIQTDLVLHQPDASNPSPAPLYTLVRSSVTSFNQDWYQTNVPDSLGQLPPWVERITKQTTRLIPREAAPETLLDDSDEDEDDNVDELYQDFESKPDLHPYRYRLWGLISSPGGGSTAALVSQYSNYYPHRRGFCKLLFESKPPRRPGDQAEEEEPPGELTTEGKVWEWMYGGGAQVPGLTTSASVDPSLYRASPQDSFFRDLRENQACVFCDSGLQIDGAEARCSNNHTFATCTSSGLAIMAPGVSRVCAVCQRRCLRHSELTKLAMEHLAQDPLSVPPSEDLCGACGGKFVS
ncbi:unnamed protein product [Clonostachys byssicola]|uniref:Transcription factor IIIC 90kDa subunit N-terminal domain-containing protein n=1 Tax=Clonostachys byssicola TaxID=160290 RepID=A0A9N9USI6_9HYPO|nr:unnamed protein product [Clonostachys byssicola]